MSRKHYIALAEIIAAEIAVTAGNGAETRGAHKALRNVALSMSDVFAADNPAFDRDRFYAACDIARYSAH